MKNPIRFGVLLGALILALVYSCTRPSYPSIDMIPNLPKINTVESNPDASEHQMIRLVDDKQGFYCTAVVFDAQYAVTAAHCLRDDNGRLRKKVFKIFNHQDEYTGVDAIPAGLNNRMDYGILKGDFRKFVKATLIVYTVPLFDKPGPYTACGFPYGQKRATCTEYRPRSIMDFHFIGIGAVYPGMSGGPVVDLSDDSVVAVNSAAYDGGIIVTPLIGLYGSFGLE